MRKTRGAAQRADMLALYTKRSGLEQRLPSPRCAGCWSFRLAAAIENNPSFLNGHAATENTRGNTRGSPLVATRGQAQDASKHPLSRMTAE